jgi:hypothetical protein
LTTSWDERTIPKVEERRTHSRLLACIPAYLESTRDPQDLALIRDVSVRGARLFTRTSLPNGMPVHLQLYIGGEAEAPKHANGHVVRADRRDVALSDVWSWEVGVEFDSPIEGYEHEIEELSKRQEEIGILKPKS